MINPQTTDERLERLENAIVERLGQPGADVRDVRGLLQEFRAEVRHSSESLGFHLELMTATLQSLDMRVPGLTKAVMELQTIVAKLQRPIPELPASGVTTQRV